MHKRLKGNLISYSFILPFFVFFGLFITYPIFNVFYLSFQSGTFLDPFFQFTGLDNFRQVLSVRDFIRSFQNSFRYILMVVPICQVFAMGLALLLRKKTRIGAAYESVFFMPMLISMVGASVLIAYVLSNKGPVNALIQTLGLQPVNWFGKPMNALISVMILEIWKGGTFFIFVYISAIRAIPQEYSEAAAIDGANAWQEVTRITLPLLSNSIILCVTMNTIWQFQIFESVYMLTGGGPLKATESVIFTIYQYSFKYSKVGVGAAASVMFLGVILMVCGFEALLFRLGDRSGRERERV